MYEKKYELTNETIKLGERTLYRIRALKDFYNVKKGDLGGYIEKEENLSQDGNCWVFNNARVYGDAEVFNNASVYCGARVHGYARVYGDAEVYGCARVYDNAIVCGDTEVYGCARVYDNAIVCGDTEVCEGYLIGRVNTSYKDIFQYQCKNRVLTAILTENNEVLYTIGCQINITKEVFLDRVYHEDGGIENNPHRKEYLKLIPLIENYFSE